MVIIMHVLVFIIIRDGVIRRDKRRRWWWWWWREVVRLLWTEIAGSVKWIAIVWFVMVSIVVAAMLGLVCLWRIMRHGKLETGKLRTRGTIAGTSLMSALHCGTGAKHGLHSPMPSQLLFDH